MNLFEEFSQSHGINWIISEQQIEYKLALKEMDLIRRQVEADKLNHTIWFLEHPEVITLGSSGSEQEIIDKNIPYYQVERGGKATYHGPGQRVIYLILNLRKIFTEQNLDIRKFVFALESWIIKTLNEYGIKGKIYSDRVGVWVDTPGKNYPHEQAKIAAIGIKISRWVSFHGIAININPDLNKFAGIIPCGLKEFGVTSFEDLGYQITQKDIDLKLIENFNIVKEMLCF